MLEPQTSTKPFEGLCLAATLLAFRDLRNRDAYSKRYHRIRHERARKHAVPIDKSAKIVQIVFGVIVLVLLWPPLSLGAYLLLAPPCQLPYFLRRSRRGAKRAGSCKAIVRDKGSDRLRKSCPIGSAVYFV